MLTDRMSRVIQWAAPAFINLISPNFWHRWFGLLVVVPGHLLRGVWTLARVCRFDLLGNASVCFTRSSPAWLSASLLFLLKYYSKIISGVCFNLHGSSADCGSQQGKCILKCLTFIKYTCKPLGDKKKLVRIFWSAVLSRSNVCVCVCLCINLKSTSHTSGEARIHVQGHIKCLPRQRKLSSGRHSLQTQPNQTHKYLECNTWEKSAANTD